MLDVHWNEFDAPLYFVIEAFPLIMDVMQDYGVLLYAYTAHSMLENMHCAYLYV